MKRAFHEADAVRLIETVALIGLTPRKGVKVSIVEQAGIRMAEVRHVSLTPDGRAVETAHPQRATVRSKAIARVVEALASCAVRLGEEG